MARPSRVDEVLFEIARTLDFCRNDPAFPGSHRHRACATGHVEARLEGGRVEMELIEWKGGERDVVGGDWYEIPSLLLSLSRLIEATHGAVTSFTGQFSAQDVLTLQARGTRGVLGEWSLAFRADDAEKARQESPEASTETDEVCGIPAAIVPALRTLNDFLRERLFPLKPKAELPIRFWKIADPVVLWTALQYLYGHLLAIVDDDESALPPLPDGYATVCTIFHAFEQIDNEGVETAIGNLGPDYRDPLVAQLRGIGLDALADAFARAWAAHPTSANADADAFDAAADRLHEWIEADATLEAIHRYVAGHAEAFESPGRDA